MSAAGIIRLSMFIRGAESMADVKLKNLHKMVDKLKTKSAVYAGVFSDAKNEVTGEPVVPYAAKNEFGGAGVPARPFVRITLAKRKKEWIRKLKNLVFNGGMDANAALNMMGVMMADDIQETITSNLPPPNSPATIKRKEKKGSHSNGIMYHGTLVDTGSLYMSIRYEVREGEK